ncbi:MAG: cation-transporting P-type ATPase [Clostridia bacterium]|nr:cation-transporting P-type ATPase [Clostridia bacterium]
MARWFDLTPEETAETLGSDLYAGLTAAEAKRRTRRWGFNRIFPIPEGNFTTYLRQITLNPLSVLLLLTAVLSAFFGNAAVSLTLILLLGIGYASLIFVYNKAQRIFAGMSKFSLPYAKVIRDGRMFILRQEQLVPGDVILLFAGDIVPADARLIEDQDLYLLESGITDAKGAVRKNAAFYDYRNLEPHQQVNMVFASTIVARGRGRAIVCLTGEETLVCRTHKNRPAVRYDKLTLFDQLQKISHYASLLSILLVFLLTLLNLVTHRWEVLGGFLTLLALSVSALSEFYTAFARILVASGIFGAVKQQNKVTKGALIKNADKLSDLAGITTLLIPPECLVSERDMRLSSLMAGGTFYDFDPQTEESLCQNLLRYGVLSTGIYGTDRLVALGETGATTFSFEEDAILKAGSRSGIWSARLDEAYSLIEHRRREDTPEGLPVCDLTLTRHSGQYILIARGDVRQILTLCSHYTDAAGLPRSLSSVRRQQILTDAGQLMRGGRQITAIATTLTAARGLASLGDLTGQLTFEGLLSFDQPLLPGCAKTVRKLKDAGLRIILLCPEESERGYYLAEALGILDDRTQAVTAGEIREMGDDLFLANFTGYTLYQGLSVTMRRTVMKLWKDKGERVLYMGRELAEITLIREADVGATQALTLSGKGLRSLASPSGAKIPVHFSQSSDGALNGCDALRFVSDVVLSMVDRDGSGGLNALTTAICSARHIFRGLKRMFVYLTASLTARLLLTLIGFAFGGLWLSPVQLLFWGMIVDLAAILTLALDRPTDHLARRSASRRQSAKDHPARKRYQRNLFLLSVAVGGTLAVSQLALWALSLLWQSTAAQRSSLLFLSTLPAMIVLLVETGRHTGRRTPGVSVGKMFIAALVLICAFICLCFVFPVLGSPFGIVALPLTLAPLLLIPGLVILLLGEGLHRFLGDLN